MTIQSKLDRLADEIYPEGRQFIDTDTATFRVRKEWAEKLRAIRAAVGGEAVAWCSPSTLETLEKCRNDDYNGTVEVWMREEKERGATVALYASPPATVDVGALRELVPDEAVQQHIGDHDNYWTKGFNACRSEVERRVAALIGEKA